MDAMTLNPWEMALLVTMLIVCALDLAFSLIAWKDDQATDLVKVIKAEVARVYLYEGDTLVITFPGRLTKEQRDQIASHVWGKLPFENNVLVLDGGMTVAAVISTGGGSKV